jgi:hypothetical protein
MPMAPNDLMKIFPGPCENHKTEKGKKERKEGKEKEKKIRQHR